MASPPISQRAKGIPASAIRKLYKYAAAAKRRGKTVHHLNIGQPDLPTPARYFSEARKALPDSVTYAPSGGIDECLDAWVEYYRVHGIRFSEHDIITTTGGSEAIQFAMAAVANCGDEILTFEPTYTNYISIAEMLGITLTSVRLKVRNNFQIPDAKTILKSITPRTKAIIVNNPSNPTGTVFSQRSLEAIVEVARKKRLFVIADEVYREIVFNGTRHISMMDFPEIRDRVIMVDSVSKRFNLCGARIGCIATKHEGVRTTAMRCAQGRLSASSLEQMAVTPLLKNPIRYTKTLVKEYERRKKIVIDKLRDIPGVTWARPEGAFYIFAELPVKNAEHFCQWLLEKYSYKNETVMLAPGSGFYVSPRAGQREIRIAYVLGSPRLERALDILKRGLEKYNG